MDMLEIQEEIDNEDDDEDLEILEEEVFVYGRATTRVCARTSPPFTTASL